MFYKRFHNESKNNYNILVKEIQEILKIEDPVKRRAVFVAMLTKEFKRKGIKEPVVVGGMAVEIYTQGSYTTGDIDLKSDKKTLEETLIEWGFNKKGRVWFNEDLDIYIDWLGSSLEEGAEAEKRINTIVIDKNLELKIISIEDLIIDRLKAYKWWKDRDSFMWAKVLWEVKKSLGDILDKDYLRARAAEEKIEDVVEELLKDEPN